MGINVTLRGMIAIFMIGFVWLGLMPTIDQLVKDPNLWGDVVDSRMIFLKENAVNLYLIAGLIALFASIVWMLNSASAKGAASIYG